MTRLRPAPLWVVECADPACGLRFETRAHNKPQGAYCSLDCWQRHHGEVALERLRQRQLEEARLDEQVRRLDPFQGGGR